MPQLETPYIPLSASNQGDGIGEHGERLFNHPASIRR